MALITVIVPVYKVEGYLPRCMESILGQSLQDFQLILVSDGSPGPLPPALPELRPADPSGCKPLKRLQNPNQRPRPPQRGRGLLLDGRKSLSSSAKSFGAKVSFVLK